MALIFHLGPSGSGKSYELHRRIADEAEQHFATNYMVIVPEQFTLQTQRDMIEASSSYGIMNIDVLSFPRLAHRVFSELGITVPMTLEDTGKTMIVKKVAMDCRDRLGIYAGKVGRQGFISRMKSLIAELYQYGIAPKDFDVLAEVASDHTQLVNKLKDVKCIYEGFAKFIADRFIMNEELPKLLSEHVCEAPCLKKAVMVFDGFTGFTVGQLQVIDRLMDTVSDIHVALTIDEASAGRPADKESLFYLSAHTIEKLTELADRHGMEVIRDNSFDRILYRFKDSPALAALEKGLFRHPSPVFDNCEGISLVSLASPRDELKYVISKIRSLISEHKLRYSDIAVVTGDIGGYSRQAGRAFTRAGIPYYLDEKKSIIGTPPVEFVRAVLQIAERDYAYADVFRFLKTGLTPLEPEEVAGLENYCLATGIRGRHMWNNPWTRKYKTRYEFDIQKINELRQRICDFLEPVCTVLRDREATVMARLEALKQLFEACGVEEKLETKAIREQESEKQAERLNGIQDSQLFGMVMQVFDRIGMLLGEDVLPAQEFREILETGFSEAKLRTIPQGSDSVLIGDIERSRLTSIKVLFFIGVNDNIIPGTGSTDRILSDTDRRLLEEHDIELSPTGRQSVYLTEFYLYLNLTKPSSKLYVTWHRMTADRKEGRPAYLVGGLMKMFPKLQIQKPSADDYGLLIGTDCGEEAVAEGLRELLCGETGKNRLRLMQIFSENNPERYDELTKAAGYCTGGESITSENAAKLYEGILTGSVTLLERYASCAFSHFIRYGLRLEERSEYRIDSASLGNIYHRALELYGRELKDRGIRWHDTDESVRSETADRALEGAFTEYESILKDTKRNEYMMVRLRRIFRRTVEVLDRQVRSGEFEPERFEQEFVSAGEFMRLQGKIDRMDICVKNGKKYLRVIDYKSGTQSFDLTGLYYGLQIQLGLYMKEGSRLMGADAPAGLYYYCIDDPILNGVSDEDKTDGALKLGGPSNSEAEALILQDNTLCGESGELRPGSASNVISVKLKSDGSFDSNSKLMNPEQFNALGKYLDLSLAKRTDEIRSGRITTDPFEDGKTNACKYCPYMGICGFDKRLGSRYRTIRKEQETDIWEKINGALNS